MLVAYIRRPTAFYYRNKALVDLTCFENTVISSSKDSDEQTSPVTPLSLGVQVANSHFSKTSASRGKRGCLKNKTHSVEFIVYLWRKSRFVSSTGHSGSRPCLFSLHNFFNNNEIKYRPVFLCFKKYF